MKLNKIKIILEESGRKQTYIAEKLGMSYQQINEWCNNKRQPSLENLYKIAEILDVEVKDLIIDKKELEDNNVK